MRARCHRVVVAMLFLTMLLPVGASAQAVHSPRTGATAVSDQAAGAALAWGDNVSGDLGVGTSTSIASPVQVHGLAAGVRELASGGSHGLALTGPATAGKTDIAFARAAGSP